MPRRLVAIIAISFGTALFVIDGNIPNVALPTIARDLNVQSSTVVTIISLYQLVLVMALLPFGSLGDRIGYRRMYQTGQTVFMLASASALLVQTFPELLVVRAFQAIGAGMAMSVSAAQLRSIYPSRLLGTGLGISSIIIATSNAIAPTLGGFIVAHLDWRWVFFAAAPLALISLALGRALPKPVPRPGKIDLKGGAWSALTFGLVIGGLELSVHGDAKIGVPALILGLISAVTFVRRESGRERPVLPVDLLRQPVIGLSVMAAVAGFLASASLIVILPFRLEDGMGYSPTQVGLMILPFPLTMLIVAPLAGFLSDRFNPSRMGILGMATAMVGLASLAMMPDQIGWLNLSWRLSITAIGFGLFFAPNSRLIISSSPRDRSAAAGSMLSTARLFGQTLGATMIGIVLAMGQGQSAVPFIAAIVFALAAALGSVVRLKTT